MPELLLEIGCEEIPADDLLRLPEELAKAARASFDSNRLVSSDIRTYSTPRRLTLVAIVESMQSDLREEKLGPPKKVAFDASGNPTRAALGFAANLGIAFDKVRMAQTPKGEYLAADILQEGKPAAEILKEIVPAIISGLPFKKFMKWGSEPMHFGRPIRRIVALFNGEIVPLTLAGVDSGRSTFGHRFLGTRSIEVKDFRDYCEKLKANGVILGTEDRTAIIREQLKEKASAAGGILKEDEDLLRTMADEVEYPEVLGGSFPREFLKLPQEILINAMRKHQKYFCAVDSRGKLLPVFFTVLNTHANKPDLIRIGHERVLIARLRDAEFFWNEDRKTKLQSRQDGLVRLTYHEKLGPYSEKIERMISISTEVSTRLKTQDIDARLQKLIRLSKTDLLTLMVGEFPELQGVMAGLYAMEEGCGEEEWQALYDQYLPASAEDTRFPRSLVGALLSIVDRVEILASGYILNMIPTGSKDPYALRRVATGAMRILLEHKLNLDFQPVFEKALSLYSRKTKLSPPEMLRGLMDLMEARFRFLMEQRGIPHDTLNAILGAPGGSYVDAAARTIALWSMRDSQDLKTLARCFKRINNIIKEQPAHSLDQELFLEDGETRLYKAFTDLEYRAKQMIAGRQYSDALQVMVTLGPEIDNFFEEILVMAEDTRVRNNRIALLQAISNLYRRVADFSELQIEL